MVLVHPRAAHPIARLDRATSAHPGGSAPRPGTLPRPRTVGRPRFEALRSLALTPLDEARALDARGFADLPLPTVLELEVPGWSGPVWLRSSPRLGGMIGSDQEAARGATLHDPVIDGPAWLALVEAVESDRVRPVDFRRLVERLAASPRGTDECALARAEISTWMDGVRPDVRGWSVGRVIERLGARLFSVRIEEPDPHTSDAPANGPPLAQAG